MPVSSGRHNQTTTVFETFAAATAPCKTRHQALKKAIKILTGFNSPRRNSHRDDNSDDVLSPKKSCSILRVHAKRAETIADTLSEWVKKTPLSLGTRGSVVCLIISFFFVDHSISSFSFSL
jgi:hypothetical protein